MLYNLGDLLELSSYVFTLDAMERHCKRKHVRDSTEKTWNGRERGERTLTVGHDLKAMIPPLPLLRQQQGIRLGL